MGTTYLHAVASLDGYIADHRDDVGPLHDWYFKGDHPLVDQDHTDVHGAPFRVSAASADYVRGMWVPLGLTPDPLLEALSYRAETFEELVAVLREKGILEERHAERISIAPERVVSRL